MKSVKYIITLVVGFLAAGLIAFSRDILSKTSALEVFHILTDSFTVPGVVIAGIGLLVFASNEGTFDMISYGVSSFVDLFRSQSKKKYKTFYDYRVARQDKKVGFGFMLASGLILLAIAGIMYFLYRQCL